MNERMQTEPCGLFSFGGRVSRSEFWITCCLLMIIDLLLLGVGLSGERTQLLIVFGLPLAIWAGLAVQVRRWHDHDRSATMLAIHLLPVLGQLWSLWQLGFRPGTAGANRFGADPLPAGARRGALRGGLRSGGLGEHPSVPLGGHVRAT